MRSELTEVTHVYFSQHCYFLPLPHVPVGIQNAAATGEKIQKTPACIREIQVHKLWTKVYSQKGLTAMGLWTLSCHFAPHNEWNVKMAFTAAHLNVQSFWWWHCSIRYSLPYFLGSWSPPCQYWWHCSIRYSLPYLLGSRPHPASTGDSVALGIVSPTSWDLGPTLPVLVTV